MPGREAEPLDLPRENLPQRILSVAQVPDPVGGRFSGGTLGGDEHLAFGAERQRVDRHLGCRARKLLLHRIALVRRIGRRVGDRLDPYAQGRLDTPLEGEALNPGRRGLPGTVFALPDDIGRDVPEAHGDARHTLLGGDGPDLGTGFVVVVAGPQREGQQQQKKKSFHGSRFFCVRFS